MYRCVNNVILYYKLNKIISSQHWTAKNKFIKMLPHMALDYETDDDVYVCAIQYQAYVLTNDIEIQKSQKKQLQK